MKGIDAVKIYDVKWTSQNAGPSPDNNKRTEVFLFGCSKAANGNPCRDCFNPMIWKVPNNVKEYSTNDVVETITKFAPNKYITFVGGEPLDQAEDLAKVCHGLKEKGFHIIVFTHYTLDKLLNSKFIFIDNLLKNIDILIDGEYVKDKHIYNDNAGDGFHDAIGSSNQIIWDYNYTNVNHCNYVQGLPASDLAGIYVSPNFELKYITKEECSFVNVNLTYVNKISA